MEKSSKFTTEEFEFNGHTATIIVPEKPNGKWIWKTEFLYAFDQAEVALCERGFTRVYYSLSDKYGSCNAVRLMHKFHLFVTEKYRLEKKVNLFGFSRGGLYAFNYALFYPEYVSKIYLDAPVLDMKTWPPEGSVERKQVYDEYFLNKETFQLFKGNPLDNMEEFFTLGIPLMVVAGAVDSIVPYRDNAGRLLAYAKQKGINVAQIIKPFCDHHPHSIENVAPIIEFIEK